MIAASNAALEAGIRQITAEAGGLLDLLVVQFDDLPDIVADAHLGDGETRMLLGVIKTAIDQIEGAPKHLPMLCASCPRPLRAGAFSLAIARPRRGDPTRALALAVCKHCATDRTTVTTCAMQSLRRIWPDLRPVTVTHKDGGRA